jgi:hypothetical protein
VSLLILTYAVESKYFSDLGTVLLALVIAAGCAAIALWMNVIQSRPRISNLELPSLQLA